jgi:3-oxoacyl-[acyl-carrier-protein] synthase II
MTASGGRAAITGLGAVACVGGNVREVFAALCAGRAGLGPLRGFDRTRFRAGQAYEIDDRPAPGQDVPLRATRWLCAAIEEAVLDAGLGTDLRDVPVLVGTGLRELRSVELWWRDGAELTAADLHFGPALRDRFDARTTYTFSNACSASLYALGLGLDLLDLDEADAVVVAGVDSITESMFGLLDRVHPVPPDAVRPFDRNRRGVLMGDGAAAVVLRRTAPAGRAKAVLRSVALNCDAYHATAPEPKSIAAAIRDAHARAGIEPADVDLVLAHGTGTVLNDEAEAAALADVFGAAVAGPLVTAIKSMTGHTSGGSGLLSLIVAALALRTGVVPPTVGVAELAPAAAQLRLVRGAAVAAELAVAQVNAFGFGGVNAVAVVERTA